MPHPLRNELLLGARDQLPILVGVIPFGLVFGALGIEMGLSAAEVQGLSLFVFAGSAQFVAVAFGAPTPETWSLDFALPMTFLAMLIPTLVDRPAWAAAISGAVLSLLLRGLPYGLGLMAAAVIAVGMGVLVETGERTRAAARGTDDD